MTEAVARVAVLGSAGEARAHLRRALTEAGADIAIEADPRETDVQALNAARVSVVLFSVDEQNEDTLDLFQPVFDDPSVAVIFDEAAVTRNLGGWELARWARHLASKLLGDQSILLPPVPAQAARVPGSEVRIEPGAPLRPDEIMRGAELGDYTAEVPAMAASVPVNEVPGAGAEADLPLSFAELNDALDLNVDDIERALAGALNPEPAPPEVDLGAELASATSAGHAEVADPELAMSDLDLGEVDLASLELAADETSDSATPDIDAAAESSEGIDFALLDLDSDADAAPADFSRYASESDDGSVDLDADLAALAASLDANIAAAEEAPAAAGDVEFDLHTREQAQEDVPAASTSAERVPEPPAAAAASGSQPPGNSASSLFANLSLVDDDGATPVPVSDAPASASAAAPAAIDFDALISGLSLVDSEGPAVTTERGAVLVLAGAGGPDALRQVLAVLPESLPVPVLVAQHLENGNHDRLVPQLAKTSRLPVALAAPNAAAMGGRVHVLPSGVAVSASRHGGLEFAPGFAQQADLVRALLALGGDLLLVVASGTEAAVAELLDECVSAGVTLIGQDPEACFDASVPTRVAAIRGDGGELGARVAQALNRWSA